MTRDHLVPVGMAGALFVLTLLLIVSGYGNSFEHLTAGHEISQPLADRIIRIHKAVTGRPLSDTAARAISHKAGSGAIVARYAYRVLFEFEQATTLAGVFLFEGGFRRGRKWVQGWEQTADTVFGARTETLTDAEIALFCHWVVSGQVSWNPDDILATRQMLLQRMRGRNAISEAQYHQLKAQPLALKPTPVPIY